MRVDYHVHTPLCGHAQGTILQYIERAIEHGLDQIGFADHCPRYYLTRAQRSRYGDWGMSEELLEHYVRDLESLRAAFAGTIDIRIGLEVDYIQGAEDTLRDTVAPYPFDFLLGSVHCLPRLGWRHLTHYQNRRPLGIYREYFAGVRAALRSGLFDSIAHPDFVWRYVAWPSESADEIADTLADIVRLAAYRDTALEMNANGFLWSMLAARANAPNPFATLLEQIAQQRAVVSLGSDAHAPAAVGASLTDIAKALHTHGITRCATFRHRRRSEFAPSP
jgi:histidinol-phosphatase (PHP family)